MLKVRVATGIILGLVVLAVVVWLPLAWMAAFFHVAVLLAAYEWAKLAGVGTRLGHVVYGIVQSMLVALLWLAPTAWMPALAAVVAFWVVALAVVVAYPASARLVRAKAVLLAAGAIALPGAWLALVALKAGTVSEDVATAAWQIVWVLSAAAVADSGAYFAGRRFGRRKLAPSVSPGKTVEGAAGGTVAVLAWAACGAAFFDGGILPWLVIGTALALATVVGDLFESVLKRVRGVKDSGALLPGHGGVLDRVDSILAATPVFVLLRSLL